jgi:hypothetical protein
MTADTKRGKLLGAATPKPWLDWATLLRRKFDLDVLSCPCGGRLRFIALVTEREAIAAPAGESRTPDDAARESPRAVTDAVRYGPPAGLRVARGLSCGRGDVTSGFARRCAEVRALRGEKRGLGGPRFVCRSWSGPATRGWTGVEPVRLFHFVPASAALSVGTQFAWPMSDLFGSATIHGPGVLRPSVVRIELGRPSDPPFAGASTGDTGSTGSATDYLAGVAGPAGEGAGAGAAAGGLGATAGGAPGSAVFWMVTEAPWPTLGAAPGLAVRGTPSAPSLWTNAKIFFSLIPCASTCWELAEPVGVAAARPRVELEAGSRERQSYLVSRAQLQWSDVGARARVTSRGSARRKPPRALSRPQE